MSPLIYILLYLGISHSCDAYRILVVFPMPSRSHGNLGDAVVRHLLNDGNEVVYINAFDYKNAPPTLRQIDVSENVDAMPVDSLSIQNLLDKKIVLGSKMAKIMMTGIVTRTLEIKAVKELLGDPKEQFDVVIVEWMFSEVFAGLAAVFDCPLIWVSPMEVNAEVLSLIDETPNPAHHADIMSADMPPFTFRQRVEALWSRLQLTYLNFMYFEKMQEDEYSKHIAPYILKRGRKPPPFDVLKYNGSLVLGNSHVSMGQASRLPQSYKPIGGYHIDENIKPLPEDLKKLMDTAKNGVIYFSMGSNLKSKDWPKEIIRDLLKVFGELKQTVLWKFEEDLPNVPKNVHILKWAPQPAILSHPNCLLFISHGGLLSTTETIHYGVPIIGIPVFGDQFVNVARAVNKGFALKVDFSYNIANDLRVAIKEAVGSPTFRQRIKLLSHVYHDRPTKPGQELAHWVRHVITTRGASHLRSPAIEVAFYERLYLDLLALIVLALIFVYRLLRLVCAMICSRKSGGKNKSE